MKYKVYLVVLLIAGLFLLGSCAKEEKEGTQEEQQTEETQEMQQQIPGDVMLTNEVIDKFLKEYPVVHQAFTEKSEALKGMESDDPVVSSKATKAFEELKAELAKDDIDVEGTAAIARKVLIGVMYIQMKQQVDQLDQLRAQAANPETPPQTKAQLESAIAQLEEIEKNGMEIPQGVSQAEITIIETRFNDIMKVMQVNMGPAAQAQPAPAPVQPTAN